MGKREGFSIVVQDTVMWPSEMITYVSYHYQCVTSRKTSVGFTTMYQEPIKTRQYQPLMIQVRSTGERHGRDKPKLWSRTSRGSEPWVWRES